jgi:hypothetical protein
VIADAGIEKLLANVHDAGWISSCSSGGVCQVRHPEEAATRPSRRIDGPTGGRASFETRARARSSG